ncbi:hypothetical protein DL98DRAFT_514033 [Cadophora sp. DSE1049]|nr:hypothetical protein DL98DRAFT_514033 [Cadophora sp. DSE1049]
MVRVPVSGLRDRGLRRWRRLGGKKVLVVPMFRIARSLAKKENMKSARKGRTYFRARQEAVYFILPFTYTLILSPVDG